MPIPRKNISGTRGESGSNVMKNNKINVRDEMWNGTSIFLNINKISFVLTFRKK